MAESKKNDPWTDLVPIRLFYDGVNYKDDMYVAINGRRFQIQRGVEVMVPRCVKEVIDNSDKMQREREQRLRKLIGEENGFHKYTDM